MTLKTKARSPKPNKAFTMSQCYIHDNLVPIQPLVHEISNTEESLRQMPMPIPTGSTPKLQWGDIIIRYAFTEHDISTDAYILFACFVALHPSQQLWSCLEGQFTLYHTFFLGKLKQGVNKYFVHILLLVTDNNSS